MNLQKMAKVLVEYCAEMKSKDKVLIQSTTLAVPLVEAVYKESVLKGAHPEVWLSTENQMNLFFTHAQGHQLDYLSPFAKYYFENVDAIISILADFNTKSLTNTDPRKVAQFTKGRQELNAIMLRRDKEGTLNWTVTVYPTHALAQEASMSLLEYEDFVCKACFLDNDDPVAQWNALSESQEKMVNYLNGKSELHIEGEGTDLKMKTEGRIWINSDGRRNFPSGEVFTGPLEDSTEGVIQFTYPGIYMGKEVEGIVLTFEKGKVVEASAQKGDDLLQEMLRIDEGARRLGEVAIGTNYGITKYTKNTLFDEKIGGTIHLALGLSLPTTGGMNSSAVHWDIVKDMKKGRIFADGELFYENGAFL